MSSKEERFCYIYVAQNENSQQTQKQIEQSLETGNYDEKAKALKNLITNIIHDENFPRMLMKVFNHIVPIQNESHAIKKVLVYYWEIVEKLDNKGQLKQEWILVCNSIRNDLLHANEFIRGRTLRLLTRVMHPGILEPLLSSILENLNYKNSYVRRNAVACLYKIYCYHKDEMIPDIDEHILKVLQSETDISTLRTAFLLLFNCNQEKAIQYINNTIINNPSEDVGDIIQLVVLELLRKSCKTENSHKYILSQVILAFQGTKSNSVLFECANTITQISSSPNSLQLATNIYIQLLNENTDNNVKIIVLDKLLLLRQYSTKYLEDQILDISKALNYQSPEIRKKTFEMIQSIVSKKNIEQVCPILLNELEKVANSSEEFEVEFRQMLLENLKLLSCSYINIAETVLKTISNSILSNNLLDERSAEQVTDIIKNLMETSVSLRPNILQMLIERLQDINSQIVLKSALWVIAYYAQDDQISDAINSIKLALGSLPLEPLIQKDESAEENQVQEKKQAIYKTIILPDGTYGSQLVDDNDLEKKQNIQSSKLREYTVSNSYFATLLISSVIKLLYKVRQNTQKFNKFGSEILLILCAIARLYQSREMKVKVDKILLEKISTSIKMITNPQQFVNQTIQWLEFEWPVNYRIIQNDEKQKKKAKAMAKQPDSLIQFRQLKGRQGINDADFSDEEMQENIFQDETQDENFTQKLSKIIQLTGYSDPIYAEAFVNIHKYDIYFEILLINRLNEPIQNVSVEFSTQGDLRVVDKPQQISLIPKQSIQFKTSLKMSSSEAGVIFASINFENKAGITQSYMITNEIIIDLIDFIYPAEITLNQFRALWQKYEWENRILINTNIADSLQYIQHIATILKMKILSSIDSEQDNSFLSVNLYAKTTLNDDFLMNISIDKCSSKIQGYLRVRSKTKGIVINLGERIRKLQNI